MKLTAETIAQKYKQLWMVEDLFRTTKFILTTRPNYHKMDETINGLTLEWQDVIDALDDLEEIHIVQEGKEFIFRSQWMLQ